MAKKKNHRPQGKTTELVAINENKDDTSEMERDNSSEVEKKPVEDFSEGVPSFDGNLLLVLAEDLENLDKERFANLKTDVSNWMLSTSSSNPDHQQRLRTVIPSIYGVLHEMRSLVNEAKIKLEQEMQTVLEVEVVPLRHKIQELKTELAEEKNNSLDLEDKIKKMALQIAEEKEHAEELQQSLYREHEKIENLWSGFKREQSNVEENYTGALKESQEEAQRLKNLLQKKEEEHRKDMMSLEVLRGSEDKLLMEILRLEAENSTIEMLKKELERYKENEIQAHKEFEKVATTMKTVNTELQSDQRRIEALLVEIAEYKRQIEAKDAYIDCISNDLEVIILEKERLSENLSTSQAALLVKTAALQEFEVNLNKKISEQSLKAAEFDEFKREKQASSLVVDHLRSENMKLKRELTDAKILLSSEKGSLQRIINAQLDELKLHKEESKKLNEQIKTMTEEFERLAVENEQTSGKRIADHEKLQAELKKLRFELEQVRNDDVQAEAHSKILLLERRISELETDNEQLVLNQEALIKNMQEENCASLNNLTKQLSDPLEEWKQRYEEVHTELCELRPALKIAHDTIELFSTQSTEMRSKLNQIDEWEQRYEEVYTELRELRPALKIAQDTIALFSTQSVEMRSQLTSVFQERNQLLEKLHVLQNETSQLSKEADITKQNHKQQQTCVDMETEVDGDNTADRLAHMSSYFSQQNEKLISCIPRPIIVGLNKTAERIRSSRCAQAGVPFTQPMLRKTRAFWNKNGFRPYFRYFLVLYAISLHLMLFISWLHLCVI